MLVRTKVVIRGAPGIVVTFWKFNVRALWNCTNGSVLQTNFYRHLGCFNPWWLGSRGGRNWETSLFGFQPQREQIISYPFSNFLEHVGCFCCSAFSDRRGTHPAEFGQKNLGKRTWAASILRARNFPAHSELHQDPAQLLEEQGEFPHGEKIKPREFCLQLSSTTWQPQLWYFTPKPLEFPVFPTDSAFWGCTIPQLLVSLSAEPCSHSWERTELLIILLIISSRLIRKTPVPTNCLSVIKRIITKPLWASNNPLLEAQSQQRVPRSEPCFHSAEKGRKNSSHNCLHFSSPKNSILWKLLGLPRARECHCSVLEHGAGKSFSSQLPCGDWELFLKKKEMQDNWIFVNQG